ncbi:hypothetical protein [Caulobacter sp. BK020]|uniref:hypothetical protein n=1 Tax=Caulobacter sp. BK020 TaxID=2512117 RepID=UPI00104A5870|nr:hypothetical protein [Caulobacter sp. BK020]TCS13641.1 hypothetical protein EV278_109101 [Caulobacter sp. BK020]
MVAALALLAIATSAAAFQQPIRPMTTTAVPTAPYAASAAPTAPRTYDECLRSYAGRTDPTAYCRRRFPDTAPSTTAPGATTTPGDSTQAPTREPVDVTPQIERLIDAWRNRPRPPPATPSPPADPLAVIPDIQAACAAYADTPERWRRCTADRWRQAGLRGQPPLVLQTPPTVEPAPVEPRPTPPVVQSKPPVQTPRVQTRPARAPPTLTSRPVEPEPVQPTPVVEPQSPPVAAAEPPPSVAAPPPVAPPPIAPPAPLPAKAPTIPIWLWLVALAVAAGGGFGLARWLGRARPASSHAASVPCAPEIALVPDPGVVVLKPDGPPRAGMAVSLRFALAADAGEVRLDYPALETAP